MPFRFADPALEHASVHPASRYSAPHSDDGAAEPQSASGAFGSWLQSLVSGFLALDSQYRETMRLEQLPPHLREDMGLPPARSSARSAITHGAMW